VNWIRWLEIRIMCLSGYVNPRTVVKLTLCVFDFISCMCFCFQFFSLYLSIYQEDNDQANRCIVKKDRCLSGYVNPRTVVTYCKYPAKRVGKVQSGPYHHIIEWFLFSPSFS
jgi:hypothetical protein